MTRVFLVDDHRIVREGLRAVLATQPKLTVVGEAENGQDLLDQLATTPTDVVLMDANMPVLNGLATTQQLRLHFPEVRILMLSMLSHERNIGELLDAGAHGYILKNADQAEIIAAILAVAAGKQFLCSELGLAMLRKVLAHEPLPGPPSPLPNSILSKREVEVLQLLAQGMTNGEVAERLATSKRTIETHRQNIIEKTQMKNTASLIRYAMEQGIIRTAYNPNEPPAAS
jgi:DNA-binding NarL/FixJ family response regulator